MQRLPVPVIFCLLINLGACGVAPEGPPVELTFRDSLVGAGKVVQIENTSNEPLEEIELSFRAPSGEERKYSHPALEGYESFEVGWKKLGGWQIVDGTDVEVKCKGYLLSVSGKIE